MNPVVPFKSLYDSLLEQGLVLPDALPVVSDPSETLVAMSGKAFSEAVLSSEEFRLYIVEGLQERNLPPAVLCRLMDHGWGKPPERVEHTGKDGSPIAITEVRRVIVRVPLDEPVEHDKVVH